MEKKKTDQDHSYVMEPSAIHNLESNIAGSLLECLPDQQSFFLFFKLYCSFLIRSFLFMSHNIFMFEENVTPYDIKVD